MGGIQNPHQVLILPYWVCRRPMDSVALLQPEARAKCTGVHHQVQKYGHHDGYLYQEPKFTH
jgi:hypothetical protein